MNLPTASDQVIASPVIDHGTEVIRLDNVTVKYTVPHERIGTFKEYMIRRIRKRVSYDTFLALNDLSLTVYKGEVLGIIGQNGAGKSTLLKLIAKVLKPTKGKVFVRGRVAPLLELGAGFHPDLTGRENVSLYGALLGFDRRTMDEKFQGIVDFAELWEFIDAPLRTYSSGMAARLGFAVATDVRPDVLIVDEILGVGDEAFQRKCAERIRSFQEQGASILLVSHSMSAVESMCQRAAWLDHGEIKFVGSPADAIQAYRAHQG
jgi:ABC-2 type transport system ATP-binding protein/lipopolysaccharide transport system ATP-binding protein